MAAKADVSQSNCDPVDFNTELGATRRNYQAAWCFANVTADLLTQTLKLPNDERVSSIDIIANYLTLNPLQLEKNASLANAAKFLREDQIAFRGKKLKDRGFGLVWVAAAAYQARGGSCSENATKGIELPMQESSDVKLQQFALYVEKRCLPRRSMPILTFEARSLSKSDSPFSLINNIMDSGRALGIGFNDAFLFETPALPDNSHGAVLSARRWNSKLKQCEYFIRDDLINRCSMISKKFRNQCEPSGIWVASRDLAPAIFSIQSVQKN